MTTGQRTEPGAVEGVRGRHRLGSASPRVTRTVVWLLMVSIGCSGFFVSVGFAIKPFMVVSALMAVLLMTRRTVPRIQPFEIFWFTFVILYSATTLYAADPRSGARLSLGLVLISMFYMVWRAYLPRLGAGRFVPAARSAAKVLTIGSLFYYVLGMLRVGGHFGTFNHHDVLGVMIDRNLPRLIGAVGDPNIFGYVFTWVVFLLAFTHRGRWWAGLAIVTVVLTLSKGAAAGLLAGSIVHMLVRLVERRGARRRLLVLVPVVMLCAVGATQLDTPLAAVVQKRLDPSNLSSGRFALWQDALSVWREHPLLGIGANSFRLVNQRQTGNDKYVHNTYLSILVDSGVLVLAIYLSFHVLVFLKAFRLRHRLPWMLPTIVAMQIQLVGLSLLINETFFVLLAVMVYASSVRGGDRPRPRDGTTVVDPLPGHWT